MAAGGCGWTLSILRSAHEPTGADDFSVPSRLVLASLAVAAEPERPRSLGSYAAPHHSLAAFAFCLSSLSSAAHGRHYLRQEPDAGNPLVRIRGGVVSRTCSFERDAVLEMKVGPSKPVCRSRLQTAMSCFGQKPRW